MENLKIDGYQWLRDRAEARRKIARIKRNKVNDLKNGLTAGTNYKKAMCKLRRFVVEESTPEAPTKYTPANADELADRALNLLISSRKPCPPLPCGADDIYMDNQHYNRIEALNMLDAVAVLHNREEHRNAPNIHAFDEQYYSDD